MIFLNTEVMLLAGMAGLYLYDCAQLLASNEGLLIKVGKESWSARFGSDSFQVRGKEPCLPDPLLPHRPLFRFSWNKEGIVRPSQAWTPPGNEYAILALPVWMMGMALFLLIPLGLFSRLGHLAIATGIVLFYFNALLALTLIWFKRQIFRISARRFAALGFECLTCPPFAVNLIRHLSLSNQPSEDFLSVVDRLLTGETLELALNEASIRVKNDIDWEEEGTARSEALIAHQQQLSRKIDTCRVLNS